MNKVLSESEKEVVVSKVLDICERVNFLQDIDGIEDIKLCNSSFAHLQLYTGIATVAQALEVDFNDMQFAWYEDDLHVKLSIKLHDGTSFDLCEVITRDKRDEYDALKCLDNFSDKYLEGSKWQ